MVLSPKWPVKRGLWTWHSPPQMIFFSSIRLWSWSTIHPRSVYSLGADIYANHPQSPPPAVLTVPTSTSLPPQKSKFPSWIEIIRIGSAPWLWLGRTSPSSTWTWTSQADNTTATCSGPAHCRLYLRSFWRSCVAGQKRLPTPSMADYVIPWWPCKTRNVVERTSGILKNRFSALRTSLWLTDPKQTSKLIISAAILHNLCIVLFFKCGQPIVDHLFFDHLKSVFFSIQQQQC